MAKMVRIDIQLTRKQDAWVRRRAKALGQSQSAVMRSVVEKILAEPIDTPKRTRRAKTKGAKGIAKRAVRKRKS